MEAQKEIIECRNSSPDDDIFVHRLNTLVNEHGSGMCCSIFLTLASLNLPLETAEYYWEAVQRHRDDLSIRLGRRIDLISAMSDFLKTETQLFSSTRIVEIGSFERIIHETIHDSLTGLFNRTYFNETLEQQISLAKRYLNDLSILFIDIDNFKEINDTYGHIAGDTALKKTAEIIRREKRDSDTAARYGGEEFVLVMPHTDSSNAMVLGERIRKEIEQTILFYEDKQIHLTISGGLASFPYDSQDPKQLLAMADSAVYFAKGAGKNNIHLFKQDKRRYLRVKLNEPVLVQELGFDSCQVYSAISKDICIGGILFENRESIPIGSKIKVSVPIDDGTPVLLIGTVVRVEVFGDHSYDIGMAISFKEMEKMASYKITSLIRST